MNILRKRILVSGSLDSRVVTETVLQDCVPICMRVLSKEEGVSDEEIPVELEMLSGVSTEDAYVEAARNHLMAENDLVSAILFSADGTESIPLSQQFSFVAGESFNSYERNQQLKDKGYLGQTLWDVLNNKEASACLVDTAKKMFPNINPKTGKLDIDLSSENSDRYKYATLAIVSGAMQPQYDDKGNSYFNEDGNVTVGEFLDSLVAIKTGRTYGQNAKKSLDGMSDVNDYYNEGYNACLSGLSSPFYRLYTRNDINTPITRLELAYITVVCWEEFIYHFDTVYGGRYDTGVNIDWDTPQKYVSKFDDGVSYKVYKKCYNTELGKITSIDLNYYKGDTSMRVFREQMLRGEKAIPLPMFMSLFELDALDLFYFDDKSLKPLREVTRGELAYFLVKLSKVFNTPFVSKGDNTYS